MARALAPADAVLVSDPQCPIVHRDLSWTLFNQRVLQEARDPGNPPLERLKFLAITASNLDEFFMIRFASVGRNMERNLSKDTQEAKRFELIGQNILNSVRDFGDEQAEVFAALKLALEEHGVRLVRSPVPGTEDYDRAKEVFEKELLPRLPAPEPFTPAQATQLQNLDMAALISDNLWFRIPRSLPAVLHHHDDAANVTRYFMLDDLLQNFLPSALQSAAVPLLVRVTRDGDIPLDLEEGDPESIPDAIRTGLKRRDGGRPMRLQVLAGPDGAHPKSPFEAIDGIARTLKVPLEQILPEKVSLLLHGLWTVVHDTQTRRGEKQPGLTHPPLKGFVPETLAVKDPSLFEKLKARDILLHHPYDSFDSYVSWIQTACEDPQVTMIEQTVYRMDTISPLMDALKAAAHKKRIRVVIELRARFDEFNNLKLTEDLRQAGAEVAFGFGKLKLHAKVALITRMENSVERRYTHLSTGNYKASTAKQYTDMAVFTSHEGVGADARRFFDAVWESKVPGQFQYLVHAPARLHRRLLAHIKAETQAARKGKPARIFAKVNALIDEAVVKQLYEASQAGVQIDLVVRGACSLVPGIKGLSENIRVRSIIDRFLEHSRLYYFESSGAIYLSSADWMPRNFFSRLELAFPVLSARLHNYIRDVVIPIYLQDNVRAWHLDERGQWSRPAAAAGVAAHRAQFAFAQLAARSYEGTVLSTSGEGGSSGVDYTVLDDKLYEALSSGIH